MNSSAPEGCTIAPPLVAFRNIYLTLKLGTGESFHGSTPQRCYALVMNRESPLVFGECHSPCMKTIRHIMTVTKDCSSIHTLHTFLAVVKSRWAQCPILSLISMHRYIGLVLVLNIAEIQLARRYIIGNQSYF